MSDKDVQSGPSEEVPCSAHPDAPHGFNRNASHTEDRYVCDCEGWNPPADARDAVTDQFVAECGEEYFCVKRMSWDQKSMRAAIEYALTGKADARDDIHTCNYYCTRPACIRAQRDELVAAMEATRPAESVDEEMTRLMEIHGVSDLPALVRMLLRFNENLRSRQRPDPQILQRAPREG